MTDEERKEAKTALNNVYDKMVKYGYYGDRAIAGYLEKGSSSHELVGASAWGDHGLVDREDMMTEVLIAYLEKEKDGENREIREALTFVYNVMDKSGLSAVDQLAGYLLSGEITYITFQENARNIIKKIDRHDIILELVTSYFK